jgi:HK97 family phage major capsid protein
MNLKALYDKVLQADAARNLVAQDIVRLNDEDKFDDALALQPKLEGLNKEYKAANALYLSMQDFASDSNGGSANPAKRFAPASGRPEAQEIADLRASNDYMAEWLSAFRGGVTPKTISNGQHSAERFPRLMNALTETGGSPAGEDGGFLNPVDFDNRIIELMREYVDLANSINTEDVTTLTGWRVIEQFAAALPLTKTTTELDVKADNAEGESPKFNKIDYSLDEYSDFLRVGNNLMADTPVNLMNYLSKWFAKKVVLTNNSLILALINAITGTAVADYKTALSAIKTALNKTLDPAFSASASLFTNQSGLDLLDQLDDGTGRPLLQPDPSLATAFRVKGRPVVVLSDAHWPNMTAPIRTRIAIGSGKDYATLFKRAGFEFASTSIGGSAWRSNSTEVRGIARLDCQEIDTGAMTVLKIVLP